MDALLYEKQMLIDERSARQYFNEKERRIGFINAKLHLLNDRIVTAVLVDLSKTIK
jgi:transcription elongation factor GreB